MYALPVIPSESVEQSHTSAPRRVGTYFELVSFLAETDLSTLYRANDIRTGELVCVKLLRANVELADPESAVRFRREATLLARLQHPNIVRVVAFGNDHGQSYLVTELVQGRALDEIIAIQRPTLAAALDILQQVAGGLELVHQHGLVHRDLKPGNIVMAEKGASSTVKIIDFGLAQLGSSNGASAIIGTLRYMAPEQAGLLQRAVGPCSDLYSVGCIAYELLTGQLPFQAQDEGELLRLVQSASPPPMRAIAPDLPIAVERIVERLLAKNPDDRYRSARGLSDDLQRISEDLRAGRAIAVFELDGSNSTLHERIGKVFVGRERELAANANLVTKVASGKPQIALIGGRSGVGKSAFVNELRNRGLVRGLEFIEGKCYPIHTGFPYFVLSEALTAAHGLFERAAPAVLRSRRERLLKSVGATAGYLVGIAPAWKSVFLDTEDAKYKGEAAERDALVKAISAVFECLATPQTPLAVFLDDLQWADRGTIELLPRITEALSGSAVFLIGAYRSEEVSDTHAVAELRTKLVDARVAGGAFELAPLVEDELQALCRKLFDTDVPAEFLSQLFERSSGNAFFVWELLRALMKGGVIAHGPAGTQIDLSKLADFQLPSGLIEVVLARMRELPQQARELLGVASMIGHAFSFELIREALARNDDEILDALIAAEEASLISADPGGRRSYAFTHDKIVEAATAFVDASAKSAIHRRIAVFIEKQAADSTTPTTEAETLFELAHHFGRSDDAVRGLKYANLAGEKARALLQNEQALEYYELADRLLAADGVAETTSTRVDLIVKRAEVFDTMGKYAEAEAGYNRALELRQDSLETAKLLAKLAYMQQKSSRLFESQTNLRKALALLGVRLELDRWLVFGTWMGQLRCALMTLFGYISGRARRHVEPSERNALVIEALTRLWYFHSFHDAGKHNRKMYYLAYRLLATSLANGLSRELSVAHRLMAITLCQGHRPDFEGAERHSLRSVEVARALQLKMELAVGYCYVGVVHVWRNTPASAIDYLQRAQEMLEQIGNLWDLVNAHIFLYMSYKARGRVDDALSHALEIVRIAERANAPGSLASGLMKVGDLLIIKGEKKKGEEYIERALQTTIEKKLAFDGFNANKIKGRLLMRDGDYPGARALFEKAIELTEQNNFMRAYVYEAYAAWAESVVRDPALDATPSKRAEILGKADSYLTLAERMERRYRNHLVYTLRVRAQYHRCTGDNERAKHTLQRALSVAERFDSVSEMPMLFEDMAGLESKEGQPQARQLLQRARTMYAEFGAKAEVDRLDAALRSPTDEQEAPRTERLLQSLLEVTLATASKSNPEDQGRACLDALVRVFGAERAFLFIRDGVGELKVAAGRDAACQDLAELRAYSTTVVERVSRDKKPIVVTSTADGALLGSRSAVVYNLRSIMAAPLLLRDEVVGVVYVDNRIERGLRTSTDVQVLQAIAAQIAVTIETSRVARMEIERHALENEKALMEKDLALTAAVQQLFLPKLSEYRRNDLLFAGFYRSASQCGGDWWWLESRRAGSLVVYVGDVVGHGVASAMVTASVASAYHLATRADPNREVPELLGEMNATLLDVCDGQYYMTMSALQIDEVSGRVQWWNAGAPPIFIANGGAKPRTILSPGSPLGSGSLQLGYADFVLAPGERILVFTDGLSELELPGDKLLGTSHLGRMFARTLKSELLQSRQELVAGMDAARETIPQNDDLTFVFVERQRNDGVGV